MTVEIDTQDQETPTYDWRAELEEREESHSSGESEQKEVNEKLYQIVRPKSNPWLKTFLVGGAALTAVLVFIFAFHTINTITNSQIGNGDPKLDVSEFKDDIDSVETDAEDIEELKAQLTEKNLDEAVFEVNQKKSKNEPPSQSTSNSRTRTPPPPSANRVAAPRVIYRDRPPTPRPQASRPAPVPPAPKPQAKSAPRSSSPPPPSPKPKVVYKERPAPPPPLAPVASVPSDPYQAWTQLTNLGSFAGGDITASAAVSPYGPQDAIYIGTDNQAVPVFNPSFGNPYESESPDGLFAPEEGLESSINLPLGTTVKGKLMHDVSFVDGSTTLDKAVVELSEPLGEIPKGAMVSTQIDAIDDSGALSMSILGYEVDQVFISIDLPEIQVTSASASSGKKGLGKFASSLLNIGSDLIQDQTGQSINFNSSGRISSVNTDSGNNFLDRALGATASEILGDNRRKLRQTSRSAPKVRKGSIVEFIVVEPLY